MLLKAAHPGSPDRNANHHGAALLTATLPALFPAGRASAEQLIH